MVFFAVLILPNQIGLHGIFQGKSCCCRTRCLNGPLLPAVFFSLPLTHGSQGLKGLNIVRCGTCNIMGLVKRFLLKEDDPFYIDRSIHKKISPKISPPLPPRAQRGTAPALYVTFCHRQEVIVIFYFSIFILFLGSFFITRLLQC